MSTDNWADSPPGGVVATEPPAREDVTAGTKPIEAAAEAIEVGTDAPPDFIDELAEDVERKIMTAVVDGTVAKVVVDPEPLVREDTLEDLVHQLTVLDRRIAEEEAEKKELAESLKEMDGAREEILSRMKRLDARGSQLPLVAQQEAGE